MDWKREDEIRQRGFQKPTQMLVCLAEVFSTSVKLDKPRVWLGGGGLSRFDRCNIDMSNFNRHPLNVPYLARERHFASWKRQPW